MNDTIINMIASLLTLNGSILQVFTTLRERYTWSQKAKSQLGSLGRSYNIIILIPFYIYEGSLVIFLILSFLAIMGGTYKLYGTNTPYISGITNWLFNNSILIGILYGTFFIVPVQLNLISRLLLFIFSRLDTITDTYSAQYDIGWINGNWQLNYYEDYFAMNINELNIKKIANQILNLLMKSKFEPRDKAIEPKGLSEDEIANFLLFKVAIERPIHQLYARSSNVLSDSQKYLAAIAEQAEKPFSPEYLLEFKNKSENNTFYQHLLKLGTNATKGSLPNEPYFNQIAEAVFERLVSKYQGRARELAIDNFHKNGSPKVLDRNLRKFPGFSDNYFRLFLKLCVRMKVWKDMDPGPFLFSYSYGMGLFLLNSRCVETTSDVNRIQDEKDFRAIIALAEEQIIQQINEYIELSSGDEGMIEFTQKLFSANPKDIDPWELRDAVDLWLWQYTREHCLLRSDGVTGKNLKCQMLSSGINSKCYCDANSNIWSLEDTVLVRK